MERPGGGSHALVDAGRRLLQAVVIAVAAWPGMASRLHAQCPDGSPPPCGPRVRADSNAFVILPFAVRGPPMVLYLREGMVDLLQSALDGVGGMRVIYPPAALRRLNELSDPTDGISAAGVARALGAGRMIGGTVVAAGTELRVRVDVFDAVRGRQTYTVEGRGEVTRIGPIVDSLASAILARRLVPIARRRGANLEDYATTSPAALQAYLVAEQERRHGRNRIAAESLKASLRHDSLFGLAHWALVTLEGSAPGTAQVPGGLDVILARALRHAGGFPERTSRLLQMYDATHQRQRVRAIDLARQLAGMYPQDADAAYRNADMQFHYGLNLGTPPREVLRLFGAALALDDGNLELLNHQVMLQAELDDTTATWEGLRRIQALAPGSVDVLERAMRVAFRGDRPWLPPRDTADWAFSPLFVLRLLRADPGRAFAVADSVMAYQAARPSAGPPNLALLMSRWGILMARGRHEAAWPLIDAAITLEPANTSAQARVILHHLLTGTHASEASTAARRLAERQDLTSGAVVAWYAALRLPADSAETPLRALESLPWPDSAIGRALAAGLRGLRALRQGDTTAARELLIRALLNHGRRIGPDVILFPAVTLALALARIEAARGDHAAARLRLADVYPPHEAHLNSGEAEELRARVSIGLGDTTAARTAYRRVMAIWVEADPALQPRVAAAREALALLDGHR
jgi:hypothetical protein